MDPLVLLALEAYNNTIKLALALWQSATPEQQQRMIEPTIKRQEWWDRAFEDLGDLINPSQKAKP